ncbi:MAG TPA: glutamate--tRNA ligase [Tepidisphaeraceae bacterium]|nr:glutamate--tRNA ligase [Tepidisphaeraceae bacterium]
MAQNVVTRFAPSPTGYLHVGGARTALFSWLLARHFGGKFLLRIEDTDLARSTQQACDQLVEDLNWLGLHWDNPQLVYQSRRLDVYDRIIDDLLTRGLAYKAYETPQELEALRKEAEKQKRPFIYRRGKISDEQAGRYEAEGRPSVVRFAMPVKEYRFDDAVLGPGQGVGPDQVQDFVIRKSDGMPTYHFAVVVDDQEMGVTHVLRGQEHLLNTVNHIALQEALGYPRPVYAHLPVILAPETGEKLSKRDRDRRIRQRVHEWTKSRKKSIDDLATASGLDVERLGDWLGNDKKQLDLSEQPLVMKVVGLRDSDLPEIMVHDFRRSGYLPEVLNNFLALLGWNAGGDREKLTMSQMVELFTLEGVGKSNARFNRDKLLSFNKDACAEMVKDAVSPRLVAAFRDYLTVNPDSPLNAATDDQLARVLKMKEGFRILREVDELSRFLFVADEQIVYDPDAIEKVLKKQEGQGLNVLCELKPILSALPSWTAHALDEAVKRYAESKQLGLGKVAQPLRVAVTGTTVSPPIFESLEMLGRERTLARIDRCLANC